MRRYWYHGPLDLDWLPCEFSAAVLILAFPGEHEGWGVMWRDFS